MLSVKFGLALLTSAYLTCAIYDGCLPSKYYCVINVVGGKNDEGQTQIKQSQRFIYYDEDRQMTATKEVGNIDGQPFKYLRIYDYPAHTMYTVTYPNGNTHCTRTNLPGPFLKVCLPDNREEVWLKSPLGNEGNMVPSVRFRWRVGNLTTELTYSYTTLPLIQEWYGQNKEGASVFATYWFMNITLDDKGPSIFVPPKSCDQAVNETDVTPAEFLPF